MIPLKMYGRKWWRMLDEHGKFIGWRTTIQVHPMEGRWICLAWDYCTDDLEDHSDKETDVITLLKSVGVKFKGEVIDIKSVKTTRCVSVLEIVVTAVKLQR